MAVGIWITVQIGALICVSWLCAPVFYDIFRVMSRVLAGRHPFGDECRWHQIARNWRHQGHISLPPLLAIFSNSLAVAILPFFTLRHAFPAIGVPMTAGLLLCAALLPTWYVATQRGPGAPPIKQAEAQFLSSVRFVVIILPLLAITGLIIAIGFPYPTDPGDHALTHPDGFDTPLAGSVFCLGWVLIMSMIDGPVPPDTQDLLLHAQPGRDRAIFKFSHDLNRFGWCLLASNLIYPSGFCMMQSNFMTAMTALILRPLAGVCAVITIMAIWRVINHKPRLWPRIALICVAMLTILSGRMLR
ncbi:hypothetical protein CGLAMM_04410 [Acetobacteraceae bacterium EV16G]|uniref:Uncharacterized protein n=1 Tax=Sorlinia euscelidii TaxID=3081148 RepID=A0ABU7U075_9PROT